MSRDVLSFKFIFNNDIDIDEFAYDLSIVSWNDDQMQLFINFTKPLLVSKGDLFDQAVIQIKNPNWFVSQETLKKPKKDENNMITNFPRQLDKDMDLEAIKK